MAKPSATRLAQWKREFKELGTEQVRSGMIVGGWERGKREAARAWLEENDTVNWQAERATSRGPFFMNLRSAKWWGVALIVILVVFGGLRILRRLF